MSANLLPTLRSRATRGKSVGCQCIKKEEINIPRDKITRNTCCKVEQRGCISISRSLPLSFTPEKPNTSVKCSWREEAALNRGSSASETWPPFFLALPVPSILPCATLICYLPKQMLGTAAPPPASHPLPSTRRAACWCSALTPCTPPTSSRKRRRRDNRDLHHPGCCCCCRPLKDLPRPDRGHGTGRWRGRGGAVSLGLPPQRALQHLGGVSVVVLGQDEDHLQDTRTQRQLLEPKSINKWIYSN